MQGRFPLTSPSGPSFGSSSGFSSGTPSGSSSGYSSGPSFGFSSGPRFAPPSGPSFVGYRIGQAAEQRVPTLRGQRQQHSTGEATERHLPLDLGHGQPSPKRARIEPIDSGEQQRRPADRTSFHRTALEIPSDLREIPSDLRETHEQLLRDFGAVGTREEPFLPRERATYVPPLYLAAPFRATEAAPFRATEAAPVRAIETPARVSLKRKATSRRAGEWAKCNSGALFAPDRTAVFPRGSVTTIDQPGVRYVTFANDRRLGRLSGRTLSVYQFDAAALKKYAQNLAARIAFSAASDPDALRDCISAQDQGGLPALQALLSWTRHYLGQIGEPVFDGPRTTTSPQQKLELLYAYYRVHGPPTGSEEEEQGLWRSVLSAYEGCGWTVSSAKRSTAGPYARIVRC